MTFRRSANATPSGEEDRELLADVLTRMGVLEGDELYADINAAFEHDAAYFRGEYFSDLPAKPNSEDYLQAIALRLSDYIVEHTPFASCEGLVNFANAYWNVSQRPDLKRGFSYFEGKFPSPYYATNDEALDSICRIIHMDETSTHQIFTLFNHAVKAWEAEAEQEQPSDEMEPRAVDEHSARRNRD